MKKYYSLFVFGLLVSFGVNAQIADTLTDHMVGTPSFYTWGAVNGYIAGNNSYGDEAIVQWFDEDYGAIGGGTVEGVLILINYKTDAGGSFDVVIYEDVAGDI